MDLEKLAKFNMEQLTKNSYPGRGIISGLSPDGGHYVQIYWIMGRSQNSRNRVFQNEKGFVRTKAFDESKVTDPSLIIYYPVKFWQNCHIVSNGDQTDTIYECLQNGGTFEEALDTRKFEPDAPNFTPRISGIIDFNDSRSLYQLSIIKSAANRPETCIHSYFRYSKGIPGVGHCLHTYSGDGEPLPSFAGEPYPVILYNDIDQTANCYWDLLNRDNRVSLLAKYIDIRTHESEIRIINQNK
ncbi:MAG TPA: inosine monophosphate cyclohydrolase [Firmicutes bacterium]|nr:inosine monophosphate cyclohydrolase [Bacillota bacterium]